MTHENMHELLKDAVKDVSDVVSKLCDKHKVSRDVAYVAIEAAWRSAVIIRDGVADISKMIAKE